jgi:hypothetical protein
VENALIAQSSPPPQRPATSLARWVLGAVILGLAIGVSGALTLIAFDFVLF